MRPFQQQTRRWRSRRRKPVPICAALFGVMLLAGCHPSRITQDVPAACTRTYVGELAEQSLRGAVGGKLVPGMTTAVFVPGEWSSVVGASWGYSDYERQTKMRPDDILLAGSVGKTFFAAAALSLADEGKLDLAAPVSRYIPALALPNADQVTVRMLMSHTSGYGEYDGVFMEDLIANPARKRELPDWIGPVQRNPPSPPGTFRYSDVNYVLLAAIIEETAGQSAYAYIRQTFLVPYNLSATRPADSVRVEGLVAGYAGKSNFFGTDKMLNNGKLYYNPQFEWGGGGFASSSADLAKWIVLFSAGDAVSRERWAEVSRPVFVDAQTGDGRGLGIHIDQSPLGTAYGHSGYVPGYLSWVRWYEDAGIAVALQANASDDERVSFDGYDVIDAIAVRIDAVCGQ